MLEASYHRIARDRTPGDCLTCKQAAHEFRQLPMESQITGIAVFYDYFSPLVNHRSTDLEVVVGTLVCY